MDKKKPTKLKQKRGEMCRRTQITTTTTTKVLHNTISGNNMFLILSYFLENKQVNNIIKM